MLATYIIQCTKHWIQTNLVSLIQVHKTFIQHLLSPCCAAFMMQIINQSFGINLFAIYVRFLESDKSILRQHNDIVSCQE